MARRRPAAAWSTDRSGATAVEFAIIAPLMLLVTVGIFETIFLISDIHTAGEATRRGARIALIDSPIIGLDVVADGTTVTCTGGDDDAVTCSAGSVEAADTFSGIVTAMQAVAPWVTSTNVRVTYAQSGIDTDSNLLTPLITVEIVNATYAPKTTSAFALDLAVPLPAFETTQVGTTVVLN